MNVHDNSLKTRIFQETHNIKQFDKSFLFGFINLSYLIEDRRPDIKDGSLEYINKYKHYINFRIFGKNYNFVIRSHYSYDSNPYIN